MVTNAEIGNNWYRYRFDDITFDEDQGRLEVAGMAVTIERKPLAVLSVLLRQVGAVCTRDDLLAEVWPEAADSETPLSEHALPMAVSKLRSALGPVGWQRLQTIKSSQSAGVEGGYRFLGPIERTLLRRDLAQRLELAAGQVVPGRAPYRLVRALDTARGTQPRVWLAEHPATGDQRVFKFCADAAQLSALKREYTLQRVLRQTLQGHAGIVPVVNAHFDDEPFWVEMPYAGQNLVAWAAEGHLANLTQAQRLALFLPVAQCVQDAHGVGVLHKDIKPSNVLISHDETGAWRARLADFGSGRLLDKEALSRLGVTGAGLTVTTAVTADSGSGTLMYLAPEVLTGEEPTVQSDLYALGLVLFQLLVGDFQRSVLPGWERDVADALLREDIAAATQADPGQRVRAVAQWAGSLADLTQRREQRANARLMQDRLAEAERETTRYRARRPWFVTATSSLMVGMALTLWFYGNAKQSLQLAQQQASRVETVSAFLSQDVMQSADLSKASSAKQTSVADVLRRAAARVTSRFADQPEDEVNIRRQLSAAFENMGELGDAERQLRLAMERLSKVSAPDSDAILVLKLELAGLLALGTHVEDGEKMLADAERLAGSVRLSGQSELTLAATHARFRLHSVKQEPMDAVSNGLRALALQSQLHADDLSTRSVLMREISEMQYRAAQFDDAQALLRQALTAPFTADRVGEVTLARAAIQLVRVQLAKGELANAEAELVKLRDLHLRTFGDNDFWAAQARIQLANVYLGQSRFDQARNEIGEAHKSLRETLGADHRNTRLAGMNFAIFALPAGRPKEALLQLDTDRPWFVKTYGSIDHPVVQGIDFYRASALNDMRKPKEALALLASLKPEVLKTAIPSPDWAWRLQGERARAWVAMYRYAEAKPILEETISQMRKLDMVPWQIAPYQAALREAQSGQSFKRL